MDIKQEDLVGCWFRRNVYGPSFWEDQIQTITKSKLMVGGEMKNTILVQGRLNADFLPDFEIAIYCKIESGANW